MTTAAARTSALPQRSPAPKPASRPVSPLKLVPTARSSAARTPFVLVVVTLLVSGLLGLLLLNMVVAHGSFELHALAKQGKALDQREQELAGQVQALQAPGVLAQRATSLGMVPGGPPAFLQLPSGKVLGQPTAGVAPVVPTPTAATSATTTAAGANPAGTKPSAKPSSKPTTKATAKPTSKPTGTTRTTQP